MVNVANQARIVFQSNHERLYIWDEKSKDWFDPIWAVSGGGRGQRLNIGKKMVALPYGLNNERKRTSKFSNIGGEGGGDPTDYGEIPNGVFQIGMPTSNPKLGRCAALKPVQGLMMGRGGFFIHGQGKTGSEGCIIPVHGRLEQVLDLVVKLHNKSPLYLRVEGSDTMDFPDNPSTSLTA